MRFCAVTFVRDSNVTAPAVSLPALAASAAPVIKGGIKGSPEGTAGARVLLIEGLPHCQKYLCVSFDKSNKKVVVPFIKNLIGIIKDLARRCYRAEKAEQKTAEKIAKLNEEKEHYKDRAWSLNLENSQLKVQLRDYDKIKEYLGIDKVKELLKTINVSRQKKKQKKQTKPER